EKVHLGVDWVLKAATAEAAREYLPAIWQAGVGTIVMSVGALIHPGTQQAMAELQVGRGQVIYPAGAIAGLDGIRAMSVRGGLASASITTTKKPQSLRGAPYLIQNQIELSDDVVLEVFHGNALEAAEAFPANVNVA